MKIVPTVKKFNLPRAIRLSKTADFVYNYVWNPMQASNFSVYNFVWNPMQASNFDGTFDELFRFSQRMPLYFIYTMVQKKSKLTKTQIKRGGGDLMSPCGGMFNMYFGDKKSADVLYSAADVAC